MKKYSSNLNSSIFIAPLPSAKSGVKCDDKCNCVDI